MAKDPVSYSEKLGEEIALRLAEGMSLRKICDDPKMPAFRTVLKWLAKPQHPIGHHYARGRLIQADTYADQIVDIADEAKTHEEVAVARLRVDARKWVASKLKPNQYGDRLSQSFEMANPASQDPVYPSMTKEQAQKLLDDRNKGKQNEKETDQGKKEDSQSNA